MKPLWLAGTVALAASRLRGRLRRLCGRARRAGHGPAVRFAAVAVAIGLEAGVAVSRVHYLSDTLAGAPIAVAVFALVGIAAVVIAHLRHNPSRT